MSKNRQTLVRPLPDGKVEAKTAEEIEGTDGEEADFSRVSLLLPPDHPVSPWS